MGRVPQNYIHYTPYGAFCTVCQSSLGCEEADFEVCDTCGGEGISGDDEEYDPWDGFDLSEPRGSNHG